MAKTATKTKPALWKRIVSSVKSGSKGGRRGQWSARKAQIATARYKKAGGGYKGRKSTKNSLSKWTKQKWGYVTKGDAKKPRRKQGRYLPEKVRKNLTHRKKAYTKKKKKKATAKGKQRAKYTKKTAKKVRRA